MKTLTHAAAAVKPSRPFGAGLLPTAYKARFTRALPVAELSTDPAAPVALLVGHARAECVALANQHATVEADRDRPGRFVIYTRDGRVLGATAAAAATFVRAERGEDGRPVPDFDADALALDAALALAVAEHDGTPAASIGHGAAYLARCDAEREAAFEGRIAAHESGKALWRAARAGR